VIYSWSFTITTGLNYIYLPQPITINNGNFLMLTQITGKVAIDTTGNATYSDLAFKSSVWSKLSSIKNWRFYLTALNNFSSYQTYFSLTHTYKSIGIYNVTLTFSSSNETFMQSVNITDCKYFLLY
jgi:hypothetical protein